MRHEYSTPRRVNYDLWITVVKFICTDLETTSVNTDEAKVVQAAVVTAEPWPTDGVGLNLAAAEAVSQLFYADSIPAAATAVHGITAADVADELPFERCVHSLATTLTAPEVALVTFNGCGYDLPIIARYWAAALDESREACEDKLCFLHVDVMRVWLRAKSAVVRTPWDVGFAGADGLPCTGLPSQRLTADMFAGSLTAAHGFWLGEGFDGAHDATADCLATLRVLDAMLRARFVDVETAVKWSRLPLPGDVDFAGKFKWNCDTAVIAISKHKGTPLEKLPISFLRWMLGADFHSSTKQLIRNYLAGEYPARAYETED